MKTIIITQDGQEPYKMQIPNAANIEVIEEKQEWKNGDILISKDGKDLCIFNKISNVSSFESHWNKRDIPNYGWLIKAFCLATPEQAAEAYSLMQKDGLQWNAEKGCVEPYRWKPKIGDLYGYIDYIGATVTSKWRNDISDKYRYSIGNVHKPNDTESIEKYKKYLQNYDPNK